MSKRSQGERIRLKHSLVRMRAMLNCVDAALALDGHIGADIAQGVMQTACEVGMQISKHDAYILAESDEEEK